MFPAGFSIPLRKKSKRAVVAAGLAILIGSAAAQTAADPNPADAEAGAGAREAPGSAENEQLEKALQSLSWEQFKSVVEGVPKLKADVDAYGPLGWQYVQANYRSYPWRKSIRKLQEPQKKRLADLIDGAREGGRPLN